MKTQQDKTQEQKPAVLQAKKEPGTRGTARIEDNRPATVHQRKLRETMNAHTAGKAAPLQRKVNNTGLPDKLKSGIENLSGYAMDDVKVHYNSGKPAQLQAHAYAQGTDIHIAPGQEKHLPHEAWHVVQQKQGRVKPTMQLKSKVNINDDARLEEEADMMGSKALSSGKQEQQESFIISGNDTQMTSIVQPKYKLESTSCDITEDPIDEGVLMGASDLLEDDVLRERFIMQVQEQDKTHDLLEFIANNGTARNIYAMLSHVVARIRYKKRQDIPTYKEISAALKDYEANHGAPADKSQDRRLGNMTLSQESLIGTKADGVFSSFEQKRIAMSDTAGRDLQANKKPRENWRIAERLVRRHAENDRTKVRKTTRLPKPEQLLVIYQKINKWLYPNQSYMRQDNKPLHPDRIYGTLRIELEKEQGAGGSHYSAKAAGPVVVAAMRDLWMNIRLNQPTELLIPHLTKAYTALVSAHSFQDGNGRTVRLFIDYILLLLNRPPAIFEGDEYKIIHFEGTQNQGTTDPKEAQKRMMRALKRGHEEYNSAL